MFKKIAPAVALTALLVCAPILAAAQAIQTNAPQVNPDGVTTMKPAPVAACLPYHLSGGTTASTNSNLIATGPGVLCKLVAISTSATLAYLKVYDLAAAPTCSSATGLKHVYPISASATGAGFVSVDPLQGERYLLGIGFCVTGGGGDTDNTNAPTGVYIEASRN
jgi:hypothetical protein